MKLKLDKNKKIKLGIFAAFIAVLVVFNSSQESKLEDKTNKKVVEGNVVKSYSELEFKQSGISIQKEILKLKENLENVTNKLENIKVTDNTNTNIASRSADNIGFFNKKVTMTLGQAFVSNTGFFYIQENNSIKKYIYFPGLEKEILQIDSSTGSQNTKHLIMANNTFMIFANNTTVYQLINGDELYIEKIKNGENIYIITKEGNLVKGLSRTDDLKNKIDSSINSKDYNSGEFIILNSNNSIIENGVFDKYFFQGKQFTTLKKQNVEKNKLIFLTTPYSSKNDLFKVDFSILNSEDKISFNEGILLYNEQEALHQIENLFIDKLLNKLIVKHNGALYENKLIPRITYLKNYTNEYGVLFTKSNDEIITKTELNGTVVELGKGNIVLLSNGSVRIEMIDKEIKELTFKEDLNNKTKFFLCTDGRYAIEKQDLIETFSKSNELINSIKDPKVLVSDKQLIINDIPFCEIENITLKDNNKEITQMHSGPIVLDKDGNKYFEKDGSIYKIDKEGKVSRIGNGKVNDDGTIQLDNGDVIETKYDTNSLDLVEDKDGNQYFEKDGKIFKIDKEGNIKQIGKGRVDENGKIILDNGKIIDAQHVRNNLVKDKEGNKYFEKDGKIFKIDKEGNVSEIGKGRINEDGKVVLDNGKTIDTIKVKNKIPLVKDSVGNRYFEKDGKIFKIDKNGNISEIGKGKINKDGSISLDNGGIIDTTFDFKNKQNLLKLNEKGDVISILEDIQYQYKDGNFVIDYYILKNAKIHDLLIDNVKSYLDFSSNTSFDLSADKVLQVLNDNWGDFKYFKNTQVIRDNDNIVLVNNGKNFYIDTIKTAESLTVKKYIFSKNRKLFIFPKDKIYFEDSEGSLTYLDPNLYELIINQDKYIVSIKKKIGFDELRTQQEIEESIDIVYHPDEDELLYIKDGKIVNRTKPNDLFNTNVKKYQIDMIEPEKMNNKFIVFTEDGSELTYNGNVVKYIDPNGNVVQVPGNIYMTSNNKEIILKQQGLAKSFNIKYIEIKTNSLIKTSNGAYILNNDSIVGKHHKDNIYEKLNGYFSFSIQNNKVTIKGPKNINAGEFVEVIDLSNDDFVITEKINEESPTKIIQPTVDYEKIDKENKEYLNKELAKLKQMLEEGLKKPEEKPAPSTINYDMDYVEMNRMFANTQGGKNGQTGLPIGTGQLVLSKMSDKELQALLDEQDANDNPEGSSETEIFLPIGTIFKAKLEEAYEVPVISTGNGEASNIQVKFKGIKITQITTPRGDEISFGTDALMLGALVGNRPNERIYIRPESLNWYNEDEDRYLKINLAGATKVSSKKDRIEGIPGLFINKKMDSIIMSAGLELVKGITEAIVASQNPMSSMANPDLSSMMGAGGTTSNPVTGESLGASALGGASGSFEEIISMIKEDINSLIPFLVSTEGEEIIITITKDLKVEERDGGDN